MTMPRRYGRRAARLAAIGACAVPAAFAQPARSPVPCRVSGLDEQVRCATVQVPENRAATGGRTIALRVVILPSRAPANAPRQALFYLVGGPGLAASALSDLVAASHSPTRSTHDIVLVDQRGTGGSNPLRCDLYGNTGDVATYLGDQFPVDAVRACARRLAGSADLTQYTTANAADDLEAVRAALDIPRIDLDASAYGTRVAQEYLARTRAACVPLCSRAQFLPRHPSPARRRVTHGARSTRCSPSAPPIRSVVRPFRACAPS